MSKLPLGEKINSRDAIYKAKKISGWVVELIGGTERGGMVRLWEKAKAEDTEKEITLPHIYQITPDGKYVLLDEVHYGYFPNALVAYEAVQNVSSIIDLAWRNR